MNPPAAPAAIVTHAGAGGPRENDDLCHRAAEAGAVALRQGLGAVEACIRATVVLEDDPRGNAGTGSNLRLDGKTIEMDAAVMDHELRCGAVAAIQRVKNPIRVAERLLGSPHILLCGEGATRFARAQGFPDYDPSTQKARDKWIRVMEFLAGRDPERRYPAWTGVDPGALWNFPAGFSETLRQAAGPGDTVGAVARDGRGGCAAALSTGGTSIMLLGRVGDTPVIGGGLYAGPAGAVAATGDGEEITRRVLAKRVYDWMEDGAGAQEACERALAAIPERFTVGLIAISPREEGVHDNRTMPRAVLRLD